MPIYTYVCKKCGQKFDSLVRIRAGKEEIKCKKCGSENVQKTFASFNVGTGNSSSPGFCPTGTCNL